jgi:hypothetical protein
MRHLLHSIFNLGYMLCCKPKSNKLTALKVILSMGFVEEPLPGIFGISTVKTNMSCSKHNSQGSTIWSCSPGTSMQKEGFQMSWLSSGWIS